eukprot:2745930-Ditylum_brightwellii.AAC.1
MEGVCLVHGQDDEKSTLEYTCDELLVQIYSCVQGHHVDFVAESGHCNCLQPCIPIGMPAIRE